MIIVFGITAFLILLYLAYPLWLMLFPSVKKEKEKETDEINSISLILLSYNGKEYLKEKISFLLKELSVFQQSELIIIDNNSTDGSQEILNNIKDTSHITVIAKTERTGIPDSMNMGVEKAKYECIIFCDQRQKLSENILQHIVEPLKFKRTGAVSGCISHFDKENKRSIIRMHENFLKVNESNAGSLIGVYGPFYAIKKHCYSVIPDNIILDDLFLSLKILKSKQIELIEDCRIIDDNFSVLYDYKRARRYLSGLLQILKEKSMISDLSYKQRTMLIWHKYLRLIIPYCLILCYISIGMSITNGIEFVVAFCIVTTIILLSVLPYKFIIQFRLLNLIRMNTLSLIASLDILLNNIVLRRTISGKT